MPGPSFYMEITIKNPPLSLILLSIIVLLLVAWSTVNGLHIRWSGAYLSTDGIPLLWFHAPGETKTAPVSLPIDPGKVAWPLLVLGLTWPGALAALWLGLPWGSRTVIGLFVLSTLVLGLGSLLSILGLVCHSAGPTRQWLFQCREAHVT